MFVKNRITPNFIQISPLIQSLGYEVLSISLFHTYTHTYSFMLHIIKIIDISFDFSHVLRAPILGFVRTFLVFRCIIQLGYDRFSSILNLNFGRFQYFLRSCYRLKIQNQCDVLVTLTTPSIRWYMMITYVKYICEPHPISNLTNFCD